MTGIFKYLKIVLVLLMVSRVFAQTSSDAKENPTPESDPVDVKISGQWFLSYLNGQVNGTRVNLFTVNRGYITINARFNSSFSGRITPDVSIDQEGDGAGDLEQSLSN